MNHSRLRRVVITLALIAGAASPLPAHAETAAERESRMAWWSEARFGMFVHWGLYSGLAGTWDGKPVATKGGMEWIQQRVKVDTDTYAKAAWPLFKPTRDFARPGSACSVTSRPPCSLSS